MNKVIKGTIAAAAAIALFGGGAGSLAFWQATASTSKVELSTGHVEIRPGQALYSLNGASMADYAQLQSNRIVPGDVVVYQQYFTIDVGGTDAVLTVPELDLSSSIGPIADVLESSLTVADVSTGSTFEFTPTTTAGSYNATGYGAVLVTTTVTVPATVDDPDTMLDLIVVEPLALTLTQVTERLPEAG